MPLLRTCTPTKRFLRYTRNAGANRTTIWSRTSKKVRAVEWLSLMSAGGASSARQTGATPGRPSGPLPARQKLTIKTVEASAGRL